MCWVTDTQQKWFEFGEIQSPIEQDKLGNEKDQGWQR